MHIDTHGHFTFLCSFVLSFFTTANFYENMQQLPFAIIQAVVLGILSVLTKSCFEKLKDWYKSRKDLKK